MTTLIAISMLRAIATLLVATAKDKAACAVDI
jgi:hypothetical protein